MKKDYYEIIENIEIAPKVYKMILQGDISEIKNPGEFVEIKIDDLYLRRPISIYDVNYIDFAKNSEMGEFTIIYKDLGKGTNILSKKKREEKLDILTGLGNGFAIEKSGKTPLIIGGGIGTPPLYYLARKLKEKGANPKAILGFNSKEDVLLEEEFKNLGIETIVATADGSYGETGFVTDVISKLPEDSYSYFYSCGPINMLKAIENSIEAKGEISLEERMGCGFGACMGCSIKTTKGNKRVCKEGPVFERGEVIWEG